MDCEIQLFGAFRDFDDSGKLMIQIQDKSTVLEIKNQILVHLKTKSKARVDVEALMKVSMIATGSQLLQDHDVVEINFQKSLAILPPVCGG